MSTPYYQDDAVTLYHGDALDILPTIDGGISAVIVDPPYSEQVHTSVRSRKMSLDGRRKGREGAAIRRQIDLGFDHLDPDDRAEFARHYARLAQRWVLVFSDVESDHLWRDDLTANGLEYVRTGAWIKVGSTPQFSGDRPATGFETITIAHPKGRKRWNGGGTHAVWSHPIVLDRARTGGVRLHPTQKPLGLMAELVSLFTDPGETILDTHAGSGTTGVAAKRAGRRAILMEGQERHCETIAARCAAVPVGLFDASPVAQAEVLPL